MAFHRVYDCTPRAYRLKLEKVIEISVLTEQEKQQITQLVHHWVVPAIGCTEPICVALATSRAVEAFR